jgi:hypothetical protein
LLALDLAGLPALDAILDFRDALLALGPLDALLGLDDALLALRLGDPDTLLALRALDTRALRAFNPGALLNLRAFGALPHLRTLGPLGPLHLRTHCALLRTLGTLLRTFGALLRTLRSGPLGLGRRSAFGLGPLAPLAATLGLSRRSDCQSGDRGDQKYLFHG